MKCPRCDKSGLVQIEVTLRDQPVTMRRCPHCEGRWWHSQGRELAVTNVLELTRRRP